MLTRVSVADYTAELASGKPAPGGGSAAGLAGALGAALGEMVANFTVGRQQYADGEQEVSTALERLTELRAALLALTDSDAQVYPQVRAAYRLPKDTEEQKMQRSGAIQGCGRGAASDRLMLLRDAGAVAGTAGEGQPKSGQRRGRGGQTGAGRCPLRMAQRRDKSRCSHRSTVCRARALRDGDEAPGCRGCHTTALGSDCKANLQVTHRGGPCWPREFWKDRRLPSVSRLN
jgi:hypothetical protein